MTLRFSLRLQCVLQVLCVCLSADCRLQTASGCVSVLRSASDHGTLAQQLCSQHGEFSESPILPPLVGFQVCVI